MFYWNSFYNIGVENLLLRYFEDIQFSRTSFLMEHTHMKSSLDPKVQIYFIHSIRIRSIKQDIFEKPQLFNSNPTENEISLNTYFDHVLVTGGRFQRFEYSLCRVALNIFSICHHLFYRLVHCWFWPISRSNSNRTYRDEKQLRI